MLGLIRENDWSPNEPLVGTVDPDAVAVIQGVQEYDTLCPVNPLTGHRDSPLQILKYALSDKNAGLLDVILQELPTVKQMNAPDSVKLDTLVSRLDVRGTAERDEVRNALLKMSDILLDKGQIQEPVKDDSTISFDKNDNPAPDANI